VKLRHAQQQQRIDVLLDIAGGKTETDSVSVHLPNAPESPWRALVVGRSNQEVET
jgi:hypothetical protein